MMREKEKDEAASKTEKSKPQPSMPFRDGQLDCSHSKLRAFPLALAAAYGSQTSSLDLSHNDLEDESLASLAGFTNLQSLVLDSNPLTTLEHLPQLPCLRVLSVNKNNITCIDDSLMHLKQAIPGLRLLSLLFNPGYADGLTPADSGGIFDTNNEQDYIKTRKHVIEILPELSYLDSQLVSNAERPCHSQQRDDMPTSTANVLNTTDRPLSSSVDSMNFGFGDDLTDSKGSESSPKKEACYHTDKDEEGNEGQEEGDQENSDSVDDQAVDSEDDCAYGLRDDYAASNNPSPAVKRRAFNSGKKNTAPLDQTGALFSRKSSLSRSITAPPQGQASLHASSRDSVDKAGQEHEKVKEEKSEASEQEENQQEEEEEQEEEEQQQQQQQQEVETRDSKGIMEKSKVCDKDELADLSPQTLVGDEDSNADADAHERRKDSGAQLVTKEDIAEYQAQICEGVVLRGMANPSPEQRKSALMENAVILSTGSTVEASLRVVKEGSRLAQLLSDDMKKAEKRLGNSLSPTKDPKGGRNESKTPPQSPEKTFGSPSKKSTSEEADSDPDSDQEEPSDGQQPPQPLQQPLPSRPMANSALHAFSCYLAESIRSIHVEGEALNAIALAEAVRSWPKLTPNEQGEYETKSEAWQREYSFAIKSLKFSHPEPCTPYMHFGICLRSPLARSFPNANGPSLASLMFDCWNSLPPQGKDPFNELADEDYQWFLEKEEEEEF